jgi:hypothetical protein
LAFSNCQRLDTPFATTVHSTPRVTALASAAISGGLWSVDFSPYERTNRKATGDKHALPIANPYSLLDFELPVPTASGQDLLVVVKAVSVNLCGCQNRVNAEPEVGHIKSRDSKPRRGRGDRARRNAIQAGRRCTRVRSCIPGGFFLVRVLSSF